MAKCIFGVGFLISSLQASDSSKPAVAEKKPEELDSDIVPDPSLAALTGPPICEHVVDSGNNIAEKEVQMVESEVIQDHASELKVVADITTSPEKPLVPKLAPKQSGKRIAEKRDELTPAGKSEKKPKRNMPEGCGGVTTRALSSVICERPTKIDQRPQACPTCQNIMRSSHKIRSIPLVLKDDSLKQPIAEQSWKQKPSRESKERQTMCRKLANMEKLLQDMQSSLGK